MNSSKTKTYKETKPETSDPTVPNTLTKLDWDTITKIPPGGGVEPSPFHNAIELPYLKLEQLEMIVGSGILFAE